MLLQLAGVIDGVGLTVSVAEADVETEADTEVDEEVVSLVQLTKPNAAARAAAVATEWNMPWSVLVRFTVHRPSWG